MAQLHLNILKSVLLLLPCERVQVGTENFAHAGSKHLLVLLLSREVTILHRVVRAHRDMLMCIVAAILLADGTETTVASGPTAR